MLRCKLGPSWEELSLHCWLLHPKLMLLRNEMQTVSAGAITATALRSRECFIHRICLQTPFLYSFKTQKKLFGLHLRQLHTSYFLSPPPSCDIVCPFLQSRCGKEDLAWEERL